MPIKVENLSSIQVKELEEQIHRVLDCVPVEHLRGFGRVVVVDRIEDPRLPKDQTEKLPLLYHPRMPGTATAFGEIALPVLLPQEKFWKKLIAKAQLKATLAQAVLMLAAQHHLLTLTSRKKKGGGVERSVREYVEKYFDVWRGRQTGWRARLFKPLLPYFERWQKSVRRRMAEEARRKAAN
jgi:hypothetical protein